MRKRIKGSVFGEASSTVIERIKFLEQNFSRKISVLVLDGLDGLYVLPIANTGNYVDTYETNKIYLYGGKDNDVEITTDLYEKIDALNLKDKVNIIEDDFYFLNSKKKYDFILVYKSINYKKYIDLTLKRKLKKIMSSVNKGGYLFIVYELASEKDDKKYPKNQYFQNGEMISYFNLNWEIIFLREDKSPRSNKTKIGYILVRKRVNNDYNYHYEITSKLSAKYQQI